MEKYRKDRACPAPDDSPENVSAKAFGAIVAPANHQWINSILQSFLPKKTSLSGVIIHLTGACINISFQFILKFKIGVGRRMRTIHKRYGAAASGPHGIFRLPAIFRTVALVWWLIKLFLVRSVKPIKNSFTKFSLVCKRQWYRLSHHIWRR